MHQLQDTKLNMNSAEVVSKLFGSGNSESKIFYSINIASNLEFA